MTENTLESLEIYLILSIGVTYIVKLLFFEEWGVGRSKD